VKLETERPFALAVVGAAGSGKSTIARELARQSGAVYLDKDSLAGPLVEAAMSAQGQSADERESNAYYRERVMPAEYRAIFAVAADNLQLGRSLVIDAPFAAYLRVPEYFDQSTRLAGWPDVDRYALHVFASEAETQRRLQARGLPRDRAKLDNWSEFWPQWGRLELTWSGLTTLRLENDSSADLQSVLEQLGRGD
jgi:predicted kinase